MRVLRTSDLALVGHEPSVDWMSSEYAILSHTWSKEEVLYEDLQPDKLAAASTKAGYLKIQFLQQQASQDELPYFWIDTCCIDKRSSAELQETINSMSAYYALSRVCYVYLEDVEAGADWEMQFRNSRWFTRSWTLQELLSPENVRFFDRHWKPLGHLHDLVKLVSSITRIDTRLLLHKRDPDTYSTAQRMSWAAGRKATRVEDLAYSLLGLFHVNMTMLYGEGPRAFVRLQEKIIQQSTDHSIFAWERHEAADGKHHAQGFFAPSPANFRHCGRVGRLSGLLPGAFRMTNRGLEIPLPIATEVTPGGETGIVLALLDCYHSGATEEKPYFALELLPIPVLFDKNRSGLGPALFASHATAAYLVLGLRRLCVDGFRYYSERFSCQQIALFSGTEFTTMEIMLRRGPQWQTPGMMALRQRCAPSETKEGGPITAAVETKPVERSIASWEALWQHDNLNGLGRRSP